MISSSLSSNKMGLNQRFSRTRSKSYDSFSEQVDKVYFERSKEEISNKDTINLKYISHLLPPEYKEKIEKYFLKSLPIVCRYHAIMKKMQEELEEKSIKFQENQKILNSYKTQNESMEKEKKQLLEKIKKGKTLIPNIKEETLMMQDEIENVTKILFEEANKMVSTQARFKHEMEMDKKLMKNDLEEFNQKFEEESKKMLLLREKLKERIVKDQIPIMHRKLSSSSSITDGNFFFLSGDESLEESKLSFDKNDPNFRNCRLHSHTDIF